MPTRYVSQNENCDNLSQQSKMVLNSSNRSKQISLTEELEREFDLSIFSQDIPSGECSVSSDSAFSSEGEDKSWCGKNNSCSSTLTSTKIKFCKVEKDSMYADFSNGYGENRAARMTKNMPRDVSNHRLPSVEMQQRAIANRRRPAPKTNLW